MTPPDLAGIIERDREWTLDDLTCYASQDDRRALLVLLRETREALDKHLTAACSCLAHECRSCETGNPILAALPR